jgi:hypothetical protein
MLGQQSGKAKHDRTKDMRMREDSVMVYVIIMTIMIMTEKIRMYVRSIGYAPLGKQQSTPDSENY